MRYAHFSGWSFVVAVGSFLAVGLPVGSADDKAADAHGTQLVRGRITQIQPDQRQITVKTRKGMELQLTVDDQSRLRLEQKSANLGDFKEGMRVRVNYDTKGGKNHVVIMTEPRITVGKVQRGISQTLDTIKSYSYQQKDQLEQKLQSVLAEVDDRMDELEEKAESSTGQAKQEYERQLKQLRQRRDRLNDKLDRVKNASPDAWDDIKSGINSAISDIEDSINRARERIK